MAEMKLYKPYIYSDDGTNIDYCSPMELSDEDWFDTREDAVDWIETNYGDLDYIIKEETFNEDELEGIHFVE